MILIYFIVRFIQNILHLCDILIHFFDVFFAWLLLQLIYNLEALVKLRLLILLHTNERILKRLEVFMVGLCLLVLGGAKMDGIKL